MGAASENHPMGLIFVTLYQLYTHTHTRAHTQLASCPSKRNPYYIYTSTQGSVLHERQFSFYSCIAIHCLFQTPYHRSFEAKRFLYFFHKLRMFVEINLVLYNVTTSIRKLRKEKINYLYRMSSIRWSGDWGCCSSTVPYTSSS